MKIDLEQNERDAGFAEGVDVFINTRDFFHNTG
jgi:hypothetical protein